MLHSVGPRRARKLVSYCGGLKEVFEASNQELSLIPEIGSTLVRRLNRSEALDAAAEEVEFLSKADIETYFYLDVDYPHRLKNCEDAPILLYGRGEMSSNTSRAIAIVGTRDCTTYGAKILERLIEDLIPYNPLIVSGLEYGVDTMAHRLSVEGGLQTIGVLGHSLDRIYPRANESLSNKMQERGGLLTEFEQGTKPDRENFPQRNRIVAGMCDATIVIESGVKGGSMITARLAGEYNRDVFAVPGSVNAPYSSGCNHLIKSHRANLMGGIEDFIYTMGWEKVTKEPKKQKVFFPDLSGEELKIFELLSKSEGSSIDTLSIASSLPMSKTSMVLLDLEFKGVVRSLPGKCYALN
ncbi:MAG: DNA-protecting protein DprA [Flavobacteriales bacterium]|nr:DNA-protecting protein DprA [Flavobacteriales bacterium]MBT6132252.1 DNA-protecting protein DprA [Flavobacteriales bacterium]